MHHRTFKFAVPDIAKAAGVKETKVRYDIRSGRLDPYSLEKLSIYVAVNRLKNP